VIACRWRACVALVALILLAPDVSPALAQAKYPTRPIRIVSPFAAGSVSDSRCGCSRTSSRRG
jgi:tripartite-type tricarboxylate transporter receptor subunit TctC